MAAIRWGIAAVAMCVGCVSAWAAVPASEMAATEVRSADGQMVAFNDASTGGEPAIRLYDAKGQLVRALALADFLPKDFVQALPRDATGLQWRSEAALSAAQDAVEFSVPVPGADTGEALHFSIGLQDGLVRTSQIREYLAAADSARAQVARPVAAASPAAP